MREIYFDISGRLHSLYREMLDNPPDGYRFVTSVTAFDRCIIPLVRSRVAYRFQERVVNRIVPVNLFKAWVEKARPVSKRVSLTYATGHLVFRSEPWVVDLEYVTQLAGYSVRHFKVYKRVIERLLSSDYCKGIICWTEAGRRTVLENLSCDGFADKVCVAPLAVPKKNFIKDYRDKNGIKLLFVGSSNNPLGEFEYKGGKEVLEAFILLSTRYPDLQLTVRSTVPKHLKALFKGLGNVRLIEKVLPWEELEREFVT
ncbi:MAG: hypothetical protein QXI12_09910, partial [Candidatus Methanomethyliaceae archaeon]